MIRNYLQVAIRNLLKYKAISFINIAGLATGITSCILIFLFVQSELSYDKHWKDHKNIYRITQTFDINGQIDPFALTTFGLGPSLKENYPEVQHAVRVFPVGKQTVWYKDKFFDEKDQFFVDKDFFQVFNFALLHGDPINALKDPKTIVISEEMSKRYFGDQNPLGQMLTYAKNIYKVTGVLKDNVRESHLQPNALLSISTIPVDLAKGMSENWFSVNTYTYLKFRDHAQAENFPSKLKHWTNKVLKPWLESNEVKDVVTMGMQPVTDIHFDTYFKYDQFKKGNINYVYIFGWVAIFILLIACFNYMNLATARSVQRAKEVSVRKVFGATKGRLIKQFLAESLLVTLISLALSFALVELLLPYFNELTDKEIAFASMTERKSFWLVLVIIILFISFIGGSYPAFYLSRFEPVQVIKSSINSASPFNAASFRKLLVIGQFLISATIIISTIIIVSQMKFLKNKEMGYNKDQVMVIQYPSSDTTIQKGISSIKNELLAHPEIKNISLAEHLPANPTGKVIFLYDKDGKMTETSVNIAFGDHEYFNVLGIKLKEGRFFSKDFATDNKEGFVINEAAARYFGWDKPVGKRLESSVGVEGKVIGVVEDYNYASLHNQVEPLVIMLPQGNTPNMVLKIEGKDLSNTVSFIEKTWKAFDTRHPMDYYFLDEKVDNLYQQEQTMLTVFMYFAVLTIFISCLGLFGLASFTTELRTKEIGVRKVLGASVTDIVTLISKDFLILVAIAIMLAIPLSYCFMNKWLADFVYRIEISPYPFVATAVLCFILSLITVGLHGVKAALKNPVEAVKYE